MKTTIDLPDSLLAEARRRARQEKKTLKELVEEALRERLVRQLPAATFRLTDCTFRGKGLQPGISEGDWMSLRDLIYGGK